MNRRTKIVCTLGPATATPDRLRELIQAGMDVARLNFSHGDREDHKRVYDMIRAGADSEGHAVGILADLQGPKIRLGRFATGPGSIEWRTGEEVRITVDDVAGTDTFIPGSDRPLLSLTGPPSVTRQTTSLPSTATTRRPTLPSSTSSRSSARASVASPL